MSVEMSEAIDQLRKSVPDEAIGREPQRLGSPSLGDVVRQGDIYLTCIDKLPKGKASKDRQLAPGNTQGSRHILEGDVDIVSGHSVEGVDSFLTGPAFTCKSEVTMTHPEHTHVILPKDTTWQVTYQVIYQEERKRVMD